MDQRGILSKGFEGSYLVECGRFLITEHRFGLGSPTCPMGHALYRSLMPVLSSMG